MKRRQLIDENRAVPRSFMGAVSSLRAILEVNRQLPQAKLLKDVDWLCDEENLPSEIL